MFPPDQLVVFSVDGCSLLDHSQLLSALRAYTEILTSEYEHFDLLTPPVPPPPPSPPPPPPPPPLCPGKEALSAWLWPKQLWMCGVRVQIEARRQEDVPQSGNSLTHLVDHKTAAGLALAYGGQWMTNARRRLIWTVYRVSPAISYEAKAYVFSSLCLLLIIKECCTDLTLNSCNIMIDIQTNSSSMICYTLHNLVRTLPIMPLELGQFGQSFGCVMLVAASLELLASDKDEEVWLLTSFLCMVPFPNIGSCFSDIGVFMCFLITQGILNNTLTAVSSSGVTRKSKRNDAVTLRYEIWNAVSQFRVCILR